MDNSKDNSWVEYEECVRTMIARSVVWSGEKDDERTSAASASFAVAAAVATLLLKLLPTVKVCQYKSYVLEKTSQMIALGASQITCHPDHKQKPPPRMWFEPR